MPALPNQVMADAETLWNFHRIDDELHPVSVGIGLGSHDLGVATYTAELYHQGRFPLIVFTGANAPTTRERFPRGEAIHFAEHAQSLGVPESAILLDTEARNTPQNIANSRAILSGAAVDIESVILTCRPYQQRRAYGIAVKQWPEPELLVSGQRTSLGDYVRQIGDVKRVIDMMVGDTQRLRLDADTGNAIERATPRAVWDSYERLVRAGYDSRVIQQV